MTPRQAPEPAELGTPAPAPAEQLPGYEHQPYDNHGLFPIVPIVTLGTGPDDDVIGETLNKYQQDGLAKGLSMRPATQLSRTNAAYYDHPTLKNMIDSCEPSQAHELGQLWNNLGNEIMDFGASLHGTATSSKAIWVGQAGTAARSALSALATWSQHTGQGVQFMGTTVRTQAEAAEIAKTTMPEPLVPPYDPAKYQTQLNSTNNPAEWARIMVDASKQADLQHAKHADAIRVVETYRDSLSKTNAAMPAFTPPPTFGDGSAGHTPSVPTPGGRIGGTLPPMGGAGVPLPGGANGAAAPGGTAAGGIPGSGTESPPTAVGTSVGGPGDTGTAPASTPAQSVSSAPEIPGDGVPAGGSGGEPSFLPAAAAIGGTGPGGRGSSAGGRRIGGGFGPRGSGGLGTSNPRTGNLRIVNPPASTFDSDPDANAPRRGGAGSGLSPIPGTGPGEKDAEHRRPSYLIETEDIWGDGLRVAPPVIGEDPPEYHY